MVRRSGSFLDTQPFLAALLLSALILSLSSCAKRTRDHRLTTQTQANEKQPAPWPGTNSLNRQNAEQLNINTASARELETLPGIGKALAARIIEHRERYGPFRRTEHLIMVRGISDRRFRELRDLITIE